ncbi:hypothetical protein U1Q18_043071 [Sarracenia purpurea var. burkii]
MWNLVVDRRKCEAAAEPPREVIDNSEDEMRERQLGYETKRLKSDIRFVAACVTESTALLISPTTLTSIASPLSSRSSLFKYHSQVTKDDDAECLGS